MAHLLRPGPSVWTRGPAFADLSGRDAYDAAGPQGPRCAAGRLGPSCARAWNRPHRSPSPPSERRPGIGANGLYRPSWSASCALRRKLIGRPPVVGGTCCNSYACAGGVGDSRLRPVTPEEAAGFCDAPRSLAAEARSG
jgi:hypothetical protein